MILLIKFPSLLSSVLGLGLPAASIQLGLRRLKQVRVIFSCNRKSGDGGCWCRASCSARPRHPGSPISLLPHPWHGGFVLRLVDSRSQTAVAADTAPRGVWQTRRMKATVSFVLSSVLPGIKTFLPSSRSPCFHGQHQGSC